MVINRQAGRKTGFAICVSGAAFSLLSGCETTDPCALREAACVDVVLVGAQTDAMGQPIAYQGLSVSIYAPNMQGPSTNVQDQCAVNAMTMQGEVYGSELGPVGTTLATTQVPELQLMAPYSAAVQGKVTFQLPDSFNQLPDNPPATAIDSLTSDTAKVAELKQLRDSDPRAVRILVTQAGQSQSAWDSRCDEDLFSTDEWEMKQYYRVGQNQYIGVMAVLAGAMTSNP
jgi:hypothetical protein